MTSLFIGGCADGQRIDALNLDYYRVPVLQQLVCSYKDTPSFTDTNMPEIHTYRRERLGAPGKTWTVFVYEPMSMTEAMDKLLDNYRP